MLMFYVLRMSDEFPFKNIKLNANYIYLCFNVASVCRPKCMLKLLQLLCLTKPGESLHSLSLKAVED